ncbi:hypothetical protein KKB43_02500 [Patescibacteria group bacterium]|nr:hypothetical protein [Patescibacteria group bacterium]MBU4579862.1 hypothetical protein [Patescibacteria group bacterium]
MFNNLTDFSYKRNFKEAMGFYIFWLVFILVVGGLLAIVLSIIIGQTDKEAAREFGFKVGVAMAILTNLAISFLILRKKNLRGISYIFLALLSGVLASVGGGLLGLIPTAYLSTK